MSRALLITGATGKQGGAVVDALLARRSPDFKILAVTRNARSASAQRLAAKSSLIKLIEGNLNAVPSLFKAARETAGPLPIWGVYSVQVAMGKGATAESEIRQGKALIDESIQAGAKHFVYSSVERGGDARSWNNPTAVPHFQTKHQIEQYLRDMTNDDRKGSTMGWTILRPAIFMDSLQPGFVGKLFLTMLRDTIENKPLQWVATSDIGFFAAQAFTNPEAWNRKAVGLAGDELTLEELNKTFEKVTGRSAATTFSLLGKALKYGVPEIGNMVKWFKDEGYKADIAELKKTHPHIMSMEEWLRKSKFVANTY
ncbi:nucleoside-diphosphate-sugar epimerase family [Fusarium beomiforme]|uniref:Nucleoside-diphosphate-sugar epimerase family n=1 Tax=Fusarium beomiforme TaxID=44412 RepID=A0A9P5DRC5_9HYPO|nr:nucleoside-diphosphate-sugar epimerase family [Fusarium beomiforme]